MRISLLNLTNESITVSNVKEHKSSCGPASSDEELTIHPNLSTTTDLLKGYRRKLLLRSALSSVGSRDGYMSKEWLVSPEGLLIRVSMSLSASWQVVKVPLSCPWRIYVSRISKKHHRLLILPRRDMSSFLSEMPDTLPLSCLMLPGTHDTMAFYGWPISQCQTPETPLSTQLISGIRVLDVRLAIVKGRLIAYHGIYPQRTPFQSILAIIYTFLNSPSSSRETIVMSIKQEDATTNPPRNFSLLVRQEIENGPGGLGMWFLDNRIPKLGEVRGKVIMFSRFGGNGEGWENGLEGLGIHPTTWPNSEKWGFSWQCKNTLVRTHDWYDIPSFLSIPEKVALSTEILLPLKPPTPEPPIPTLAITFFSAASFPLAVPPTVALGFGWPKWGVGVEGVNSRVAKWFLDLLSGDSHSENFRERDLNEKSDESGEPRIRGWALMDFFNEPEGGLVPLLVECNFRGRKCGEEGW